MCLRVDSLEWRHNERDCVSNHRRLDCLLVRLSWRSSKKTSKLRVTGLCEGNSPVTGEFPAQRASNAENVSIWWRHHVITMKTMIEFMRRNSLAKGVICTGGNRAKLPSSIWRRRGRSLREVFACSRLFATTDLSQICNRVTRGHGTPWTKATESYPFSFLYNNLRKIRRETTVGEKPGRR